MLKNFMCYTLLTIFASLVSKTLFIALDPNLLPELMSLKGFYALLWGMRFDATVAALLLSPAVLLTLFGVLFFTKQVPAWLLKLWLFLAVSWVVWATAVDASYVIEAGRHITFELFTGKGLEDGLLATAFSTYKMQTIAALLLILMFAGIIWWHPAFLRKDQSFSVFYIGGVFLVWSLFAATAIRGGFSDAPQSPMSAYKVGTAEQAAVAWSAPYAFLYYLAKGEEGAATLIPPKATKNDLKIVANMPLANGSFSAPEKKANIIVVLLESWVADDLYSYTQKVDTAPNFDLFRSKSLTTDHFYADGYRTVEGIFATFCSYPNPIGSGVAGTQLQTLEYRCLPKILSDAGWDTKMIQGSGKGIVGAFAQSLGFVDSFGKTDYDFEGTKNYWGYMDDDIYRFSLEQIKNTEPPFLISINTGTTHDSYLPNKDDYVFGSNDREAIRRSVTHHADAALGRFLEELPDALSEPTMVVLVADHTAGAAPVGLQQNAIPFLMFATDGTVPLEKIPAGAGQLDVAPTIMDWLGGNVPWFTGQSLLRSPYQGFAHFSSGQSVNWIKNKRLVRFDVTQGIDEEGNAKCFDIEKSGIDLKPAKCSASMEFRTMLKEAQAYTRYTQQLLFEGKTYEFGKVLQKEE